MVNLTYATSIWNTTSFLGLLSNVDNASGGLLVSTILVCVFLITWILMKNFDTYTTLLSSSFVTVLFALLFMYMGVSPINMLAPALAVLIVAGLLFIIN